MSTVLDNLQIAASPGYTIGKCWFHVESAMLKSIENVQEISTVIGMYVKASADAGPGSLLVQREQLLCYDV